MGLLWKAGEKKDKNWTQEKYVSKKVVPSSAQQLVARYRTVPARKGKNSKLITYRSCHKEFSVICFSIWAVLKSVICTFCGFRFFFVNQLPDFWELNVCQDWVKFSYLLNEFVSWFLCISRKYKTSLYHNWESEVDFKSLSDIFWLLWSEGLSYHVVLDLPQLDPLPNTSLLLSTTTRTPRIESLLPTFFFLFVTETWWPRTSESNTYHYSPLSGRLFLTLMARPLLQLQEILSRVIFSDVLPDSHSFVGVAPFYQLSTTQVAMI